MAGATATVAPNEAKGRSVRSLVNGDAGKKDGEADQTKTELNHSAELWLVMRNVRFEGEGEVPLHRLRYPILVTMIIAP